MVVDNFHVVRARASFRPLETDPPLIVDPDAPLSFAAAPQAVDERHVQGMVEVACRDGALNEGHGCTVDRRGDSPEDPRAPSPGLRRCEWAQRAAVMLRGSAPARTRAAASSTEGGVAASL